MPYLINGATASIVPFKQTVIDSIMGYDHNQAPIQAGFKSARLEFDISTYAQSVQWLDLCNTGTSLVTLTILSAAGSNFVALSGVFLTADRPVFESGYVGPFSITVNRCVF